MAQGVDPEFNQAPVPQKKKKKKKFTYHTKCSQLNTLQLLLPHL
jgi:hypothetical protein